METTQSEFFESRAIRPFVRTSIPCIRLTEARPRTMSFEAGAVHLGPRVCWAANLAEFEVVEIINLTRQLRSTAHVRFGREGEVAFAQVDRHHMQAGDTLAINAYAWLSEQVLPRHTATLVHVDEGNQVIEIRQVRARVAELDPASFPQPPSVEIVSIVE
jgi:aspartate 1-decarboxylase